MLSLSPLFAQTEIIVDSLDSLKQQLPTSGVHVRMAPGTYQLGMASSPNFLDFAGSNSHYDFTGVTLQVDTALFTQFQAEINILLLTGDGIILKGLNVETLGTNFASGGCRAISISGDHVTISNCFLYLSGSYPYGYGSLFGIGAGASIAPKKMNGIRIGGLYAQVINCQVIMRGFGHGIFIRGGQNVLIQDCYVEGALRKTDDILAETSGPAFDEGFIQYTGEPIPAGQMISLSEDGIRAYPDDPSNGNRRTRHIQVKNCRIVQMRKGVALEPAEGINVVEGCDALESELVGFHIGSNARVRDCRADCLFSQRGVLDLDPWGHDADVEIAVLDSRGHYGNQRLAEIAGSNHRIVLTEATPAAVPQNLAIDLGTQYGEDAVAQDVELHNLTAAPVLVGPLAVSCNIQSLGFILQRGAGPVVPTNGLILHLKLDETNGLLAADSTASGLDGHLQGFPGDDSQWISGFLNGGLWFEPGLEGNIFSAMTVATTNLPTLTNTTWAAWTRIDGDPNTHGCVVSSDIHDNNGHNLGFDQTGNKPRVLWNHDNGTTTLIAPQAVDTNWNHIAVTYDLETTTLRLYVNGQQADAKANATSAPFDSINLGRRGNQQLAYRGGVDEVVVYNRALDASEIGQLVGLGTSEPPELLMDPVSVVVWEGESAEFSVEPGGTPPIAYQWYHNDVAIAGATSRVFSVSSAIPADAGRYCVTRTYSEGTATSATAILGVRPDLTVGQKLPPWVSASGLILYWNMDDTAQFAAWDQSGNNHHGALQGFPFDGSHQVPEFIGHGLQLFPADATMRVEVNGLPLLSNTTWAAWARILGGQADNPAVMSATFPGAVAGHSMGFGSGVTHRHPRTLWNHGSAQTSILDLQPFNEAWNHLALTFDASSSNLTLYVNGQAVGSDVVQSFVPFSSLNAGRREASGAQEFAGMVDEVVLYDRVLSPGEIEDLYEASRAQGVAPMREDGVRIESLDRTGPNEIALNFRTFWPDQPHEIQGKTNLTGASWETMAGATLKANGFETFSATIPIQTPSGLFLSAVAIRAAPLLFEDFETGAPGWTHGGTNDNWEIGPPTTGPEEARSGDNVYATGLHTDCSTSADAYLRSPPIDLTGVTAARLSFWEHRDLFPDLVSDRTAIRILAAGSLTQLGELFRASGPSGGWQQWFLDLPEAAYGTSIVIEFRVMTGPTNARPGWYLDDVGVFPN